MCAANRQKRAFRLWLLFVSEKERTMNTKATKTTNRLHFSDLDPIRFEDFCLALIFPLHPWVDIRHYGRLGDDDGVDIYCVEQLENQVRREWFIQCKRYSGAPKSVLKKAVDDVLSKVQKAPDVLLVVVACDVRRKAHEDFIKYAAEKGVGMPILWTASLLEARLHAERRDLLFSYFGISEAGEARQNERTVSRNIALKRRLHAELKKPPKEINWELARLNPYEKFASSEIIVHSVDDTTYPDTDSKEYGISGWFRLEIWDFYHNGLEFILRIDSAIVDADGNWALIDYKESFDQERFKEIRVFRLGRIPYRNIVDFDTLGDEYYPQTHLYCRFADGGEPYEGFRFVFRGNDEYPWPMNPEQQFDTKPLRKKR